LVGGQKLAPPAHPDHFRRAMTILKRFPKQLVLPLFAVGLMMLMNAIASAHH
jgi:hypothetical protein